MPRSQTTALCALLLLAAGCCRTDGRESSLDKHEWSLLQGLEYSSRGLPAGEPVSRTHGEYEILGLRSADSTGTVWVLLKPKAPPFYKQMPAEAKYHIPQSLLSELISQQRMSSTVEHVMRSRVE